tara:strand:- start:209 stop:478 length:270 start_codon:yes stop_codon:yes gene_type:complete
MKILIFIISIYGIFLNTTNATEKKNCKEFKKFTKDHISCVAKNIKNITLKGTDKVKKDVNSAADEVKDDASNVKDKTEKLIKKGKEKLN